MALRTWTAAEEEMARSLWRSGYSGQDIADYFGRTRCAVMGKLNRLGLLGAMDKTERIRRTVIGRLLRQAA